MFIDHGSSQAHRFFMARMASFSWKKFGLAMTVGSILALLGCTASTASEFQYLRSWEFTDAKRVMILPVSLVADSLGNYYLSDPSCRCIKTFTSNGKLLRQFGTIQSPSGLGIDAHGNVFASDSYNARILKFSPNGQLLTSWGSKGTRNGQFTLPAGITVDKFSNVWIADKGNHRIQEFTASGEFLRAVSQTIGGAMLNLPTGIISDTEGNIYVVDGSKAVHKFDNTGRFVTSLEVPGEAISIALDQIGRLYIGCMDSYVYQMAPSGKVVGKFWVVGPMPRGPEDVGYEGMPVALAVNNSEEIAVLDLMNFRVLIFRIP